MSASSHKRLFESGLESYKPSKTLDALIKQYLETATQDAAMSSGSPPTPPPAQPLSPDSANLLNELGEYFTRTARMWSSLTENLIRGPHIDRVTEDAHQQSKQETELADISGLATVDIEISRLKYVVLDFL